MRPKPITALLLSLCMVAAPSMVAGKEESARRAAEAPLAAGPETTLSVGARYLDSIFANTLTSLRLIAATPEARNGDWDAIKRYLEHLAPELPGVYFFVLPDGNYYSLTRGYTNLNLSDRAYFQSFFSGRPVMGFPIYSRSSGKKSALVAAPIVVAGRVIGALGASVFLDELHSRLNEDFSLPQHYTWFVVDAGGNTMLDRDRDFIFMNTLTQGSPSLRIAVSEALRSESGVVQYELGGSSHQACYRKLPGMEWWMFLTRADDGKAAAPMPLKLSLEHFVPALQKSLAAIDGSLKTLIARNPAHVGDEAGIRTLLRAVISENATVVNAAFVDSGGVMRHIEPGDYRNFENREITHQEQVIAMLENPAPLFSRGFEAVEGFLAVDVARPLYNRGNQFIGSVSALIRPELLIDPLLRGKTIPDDYELWIMQPDGLIIYDQNREEIGRMLFADPMYADYESLLKLGRNIAAAPDGEGSYIFISPESGEKVIKSAVWQTVRLHNREWRVVLAYRPYE